ncbi:MAG: hypothetical protein AAF438_22725, partial [Pseudomonadota bacterium]
LLLQQGAIDKSLPQQNYVGVLLFLTFVAALGNALWFVAFPDSSLTSDSVEKAHIRESGIPRIATQITVGLEPPLYSGRPKRSVQAGSFEALVASKALWEIVLSQDVQSVALHFHNGEILPLSNESGRKWRSADWSVRSATYQIHVDGRVQSSKAHVIEAQADETPMVTLSKPNRMVTVLDGESEKVLVVKGQVTDDFGVDDARLRVTLAQGSGEQVVFREQDHAMEVKKTSDLTLSLSATLGLEGLGFEPGSELYFFVAAEDNKEEAPNVGTSGTYVVRWLSEENIDVLPIEALAMNVLPAYFRSQRQIIIDTEKLIKQRDELDEQEFQQRAQSIAHDQKSLRLRYGQFLGEEFERGIGGGGPTADGREESDHHDEGDDHDETQAHQERNQHGLGHIHRPGLDNDDNQHKDAKHQAEENTRELLAHEEHHDGPGHDHEIGTQDDAYMEAIAQVAHFHDYSEQSTLFDPETTDLLKKALAQMWDAELQLRLSKPDPALPFENKALEYLKTVQQSSRIYLSRVGFKPTPVDFERRLTGELVDVRKFDDLQAAHPKNMTEQIRQMLGEISSGDIAAAEAILPLSQLSRYLEEQSIKEPSLLASLAAVQELVNDQDCQPCQTRLAAGLWQHLNTPLPSPIAVKTSDMTLHYKSLTSNSEDRP